MCMLYYILVTHFHEHAHWHYSNSRTSVDKDSSISTSFFGVSGFIVDRASAVLINEAYSLLIGGPLLSYLVHFALSSCTSIVPVGVKRVSCVNGDTTAKRRSGAASC